jgi:rRNA biogenesis protein RRP5
MLVQIIGISELELIVSLPNQLLGHIPIINISRSLTERLEKVAQDDASDESEDEEDGDDDVPSLNRLFSMGQTLVAVVTATMTSTEARTSVSGSRRGDENYRTSRRVELSLDPVKVNEGVTKADLTSGYVRALHSGPGHAH